MGDGTGGWTMEEGRAGATSEEWPENRAEKDPGLEKGLTRKEAEDGGLMKHGMPVTNAHRAPGLTLSPLLLEGSHENVTEEKKTGMCRWVVRFLARKTWPVAPSVRSSPFPQRRTTDVRYGVRINYRNYLDWLVSAAFVRCLLLP